VSEEITVRLPCPACGADRPITWTLEQARRFAEGLLRACDDGGPIVVMPPRRG
jgi:hypothetical protein